jgi:hypothetical protein
MGTPKTTNNAIQPTENQIGGQHTFRIYLNRCTKKALLPPLPPSKTQKQGPNYRSYRVLKIGNQLDRQQRKCQTPPPAQKTGYRYPLLLKAWKQLNRVSPVRGNLPIAIYISTDGTSSSKVGEKINPAP